MSILSKIPKKVILPKKINIFIFLEFLLFKGFRMVKIEIMKDPHLYSWANIERTAFDCNYCINKIAKKIGVSKKTLYNKLMFFYDNNPVYIVNWMRSVRARGMLETGHSIKNVMQKLGYKSRSHFCNDCFKWHKKTPRQLQKKESEAKKRNIKIVNDLCELINQTDDIVFFKKILNSKLREELF